MSRNFWTPPSLVLVSLWARSWGRIGVVLGSFRGHFGVMLGPGVSLGCRGPSRCPLEQLWGALGGPLGTLGRPLGSPWCTLEASGRRPWGVCFSTFAPWGSPWVPFWCPGGSFGHFRNSRKTVGFMVFGRMRCVQGWPWGGFGAPRVPPGRPGGKSRVPNCQPNPEQATAAAGGAAGRGRFSHAALLLSCHVFARPRF